MYLYHKMHNWTIQHRKMIRDKVMKDADVGITTYYNYINGKEKPTVYFVQCLINRLNETQGDIINFDDMTNDRTKIWFDQHDRARKVDAHELMEGGSYE